jgi:hypothetical protein
MLKITFRKYLQNHLHQNVALAEDITARVVHFNMQAEAKNIPHEEEEAGGDCGVLLQDPHGLRLPVKNDRQKGKFIKSTPPLSSLQISSP